MVTLLGYLIMDYFDNSFWAVYIMPVLFDFALINFLDRYLDIRKGDDNAER